VSVNRVSFHPAALEEADAATAWYAERSEFSPELFLEELDWAVGRIAANPQAYARFEAGTRRILLPHFPYQIIFRNRQGGVEILAIAHTRRRPGYWHSRA
jgi:plasmid stabilization system protein ParE